MNWQHNSFFLSLILSNISASIKINHEQKQFYSVAQAIGTNGRHQLYLLFNQTNRMRCVEDNDTALFLGFHTDSFINTTLAKLESKYIVGTPIGPIKKTSDWPDELTRINMLKIMAFQENNLFHSLEKVGSIINPSIVPMAGRLLCCLGNPWQTGDLPTLTEQVHCRWMNHSLHPFDNTDDYLGFSSTAFISTGVVGQDPRISVFNESFFRLSYTYRFTRDTRMGMASYYLNSSSNVYSQLEVYPVIDPPAPLHKSSQKNWVPFLYQQRVSSEYELMYITHINPMRVVITSDYPGGGRVANDVSLVPEARLPWVHGHLRGGTNAIRLPGHDMYIAFFHSCVYFEPSPVKTYLMGAFTFTTEPPFRILAMSPMPIVDYERLYQGAWSQFKNRGNDYVVFPTGLFLHGSDGDALLYVSMGRNDHEGWLASFRLNQLLASLVPVAVPDDPLSAQPSEFTNTVANL